MNETVKYTKEQVYEATLKYFKGDALATNVWIDKYCLKDSNHDYLELTPDDMHKRLAREFARIEQKYPNSLNEEEIYNYLKEFRYIIPGGSILYGAGNLYSISSLGNCFVIGNTSDSYGGICTTDHEQVQLMKRRAGVGHDLSHIRPYGQYVSNAAVQSYGILPFMERYSYSTREVAQGGRNGALMLTININHPDIEQFITSKIDKTKITGANISIKITDEFMRAVENNTTFPLYFPTNAFLHHVPEEKVTYTSAIIDFSGKIPTKKQDFILIKAKELWDKIIHQAWADAEPKLWDLI